MEIEDKIRTYNRIVNTAIESIAMNSASISSILKDNFNKEANADLGSPNLTMYGQIDNNMKSIATLSYNSKVLLQAIQENLNNAR